MNDHLLIIADGRSPTARAWIRTLQSLNYRVSLISTYPCSPLPEIDQFHVLPIAFSGWRRSRVASQSLGDSPTPPSRVKRALRWFAPLFQWARYRLGPLSVRRYARRYQELVEKIQPDLVHALRIPFEGMLGAYTPAAVPFLAATWGNDLTLHAKASPAMRRATRRCLLRADGLTSDTRRDVRLARQWGLRADTPTLVVPGSGGVNLRAIRKAAIWQANERGLPEGGLWVVNPRGVRPGSVHQGTFFAAIPRVLARAPKAVFICPNLAGHQPAEKMVRELGLEDRVFLLPGLPQDDLWGLFKACAVFVSPSSHDGAPNTLLEAMACGCFPVAGRIESLEEWVDSGVNGLLVDPQDPDALAEAILAALHSPRLRQQAVEENQRLIRERAALTVTRPWIDAFYAQFLA